MVFQPMMAGASRGVLTGHLLYGQLLAFHTHDGSSELVVCSWLLTAAVEREQLVGRMLPSICQPWKSCTITSVRLPDSRRGN